MMPYSEDRIQCQCCLNDDKTKFREKFRKDGLVLLECEKCSFVFIPWYYRKNVSYQDYKNEAVLQQIRNGNNWLKIQRHLLRYRLIRRYISAGRLFDLGAGWGHFLLAGKQLGFDIYGIEISEYPYLYAKNDLGLPVDHIDFFNMQDREFDLITLWDVLEHVDQADRMIEKCSGMVNKNGYMVIQVPQIDSFIASWKKESWNMMGLDHVNYFSKKTITQLLDRHGFEVVKIKSSIELKLLLMYTILPWIRKFRRTRKSREPVEISSSERQEYFNKTTQKPKWVLRIMLFFYNGIYHALSFLNIGEEMIVVARKK
jgi:2-polyprenyl-3-methyl-5-hydroxy-6-metoxy-1,4-benzoquinol methylase